jgi:hypothetical protein
MEYAVRYRTLDRNRNLANKIRVVVVVVVVVVGAVARSRPHFYDVFVDLLYILYSLVSTNAVRFMYARYTYLE